jgi:RNA-directed DNA polymerase
MSRMGTENKESCSQRDSAERKGYVRAHRSFNRIWKERDSAEPDLLSKILDKDNLNRAYKRVKANKGAPGVDGMTIEEALPWLKEHNHELTEKIWRGKYTPSPVKRVEIPKPDGGMRKLGIPTVIDRIIQQAMAQQLIPIYEPLFSEDSFGYRPGRGAKDAEDTKTEADRLGIAGMGCQRGSIQPESLLANGGKWSCTKSTNQRKTDKLGLL